ncbi:MAG TPA: hypothetical protein VFX59_26850 [Polyangiales bacterium]|nr:hypothetical protein [Polyangiales bacterium]
MRIALAFGLSLALGWLSVPSAAECRQCNSKKCFWDADCGRTCSCLFEGGKKRNKKGACVQVGD